MAGLEWTTLNRLQGLGLMGGMGRMAELGDLGKASTHSMLQAQADQADAAQVEIQRNMPKLDQALSQIQNVYDQVQRAVYSAQSLAEQSASQGVLTQLDRLGKTVSQIEDLVATSEAVYEKAATLPTVRFKGGVEGTPDGAAQWIQANANVSSAATTLRNNAQQAARLATAVSQVVKQIQTTASREIAAENDRLRREQAAADAIERREQQARDMEDRRLQAEYDREQARYNAELAREQQAAARQAALDAQLYAPTTPAYDPYATALPPAPAGYQYAYPAATAAPQSGPIYQTAPVQYAEQPAQWASMPPTSLVQPQGPGMPLPQAAPMSLYPGWTSIEYSALMDGEAAFLRGLRGLRGLGASDIPMAESIPQSQVSNSMIPALRPGATRTYVPEGTYSSSAYNFVPRSSGPSAQDVSMVIDSVGRAAASALPAFGVTPPARPEPIAPRASGGGSSSLLAVGVVGLGIAGLAYALSGKKSAKRGRR